MTTTAPQDGASRSRIDPRFRQRRIAIRRDEGRRRLKLLIAGASIVAALSAGIAVTRSPLLDVDNIRLEGSAHTSSAQVTRAIGLRRGEAMVDLDESGLAARARALPWVRTAKVSRQWPGTVTVTVAERAPIAALPSAAGGWALTDRTGRVLTQVLMPPADLPTLGGLAGAGPPGTSLAVAAGPALTVAVALPTRLVQQVAVVALDGAPDAQPGDVALQLRSGSYVRLGDTTQLDDKLDALSTVLAQVDMARIAVVDLRVPSSPAIRRS